MLNALICLFEKNICTNVPRFAAHLEQLKVYCLTSHCQSARPTAGCTVCSLMETGLFSIKKPGNDQWWHRSSGAVKHCDVSNMHRLWPLRGQIVKSIYSTQKQATQKHDYLSKL